MKKTSKISQNTCVQATKTRHFLTADQNRENYDSKVVQVVLARTQILHLRVLHAVVRGAEEVFDTLELAGAGKLALGVSDRPRERIERVRREVQVLKRAGTAAEQIGRARERRRFL